MKVLHTDSVFLNLVNFNKKCPSCFLQNSGALKPLKSLLFFENQKLKALEKTSQFFSVFLRSLIFSNC